MCSNTSSSGAGVSGSIGDDGDYASLILKKPKRQRVPKRGPGVAELEKILREQENKTNLDQGNVSFIPDHNHFTPPSPPMTVLYGNGGKNSLLGRGSNGVHMGGSGIVLPEQALLPTMWSSCESSMYEEGPKISAGYPFLTNFINRSDQMHQSSLMLQKKHSQYPSPTKNFFPHSGSSLSSSENQSSEFYLHLEPPSNQRSHHSYTPVLSEEEKIVTTKRPRTFSLDKISGPFQTQFSSPFPHTHVIDQSPSCGNHTAFGFKRSETVSRDHQKPGAPLELNSKKSITEYGTLNGDFLIFGSPIPLPSTQTSQQEFSKYNSICFQGNTECSHQISGQGGSVHKRPFYSFLLPEEQMGEAEPTLSLNNEKGGALGETIDLNLRL